MNETQKSQASKVFGKSYLIFDAQGNEFETIRNRSQVEVFNIVDRIGGEAWISGRCVMKAEVSAAAAEARDANRSYQQTFEDTVENSLRIWFGNYDKMDEADKATYRVPMREIVSLAALSAQVQGQILDDLLAALKMAKDHAELEDEILDIVDAAIANASSTK